MRPQTSYPAKTNITSLATTAGVLAFVIWIAAFQGPRDSIYAQTPHAPVSTSDDRMPTHHQAAVNRFADQGPTRARG